MAASAQPAPIPAPGPYEVKPLPFDPGTIPGLSERIIVSHHQNNYAGAVRRLNTISQQLAQLDFATAPNFVINGLKREELMAMNSMTLHELYFDSLGGGGAPTGVLADAIARDFGSIARWQPAFPAMGQAHGCGSGGVRLSFSPRGGPFTTPCAAGSAAAATVEDGADVGADVLVTEDYNLHLVLQRDVRLAPDRMPRLRSTDWVLTMRTDTAIAEAQAAVLLKNLKVK